MDGDKSQNPKFQTVAPNEPDCEVGYGRPRVEGLGIREGDLRSQGPSGPCCTKH